MDIPTLIGIGLIILGALALLWFLFFIFVVRRVVKFQDRVLDEVLGDDDPGVRHYGDRRRNRPNPRFRKDAPDA